MSQDCSGHSHAFRLILLLLAALAMAPFVVSTQGTGDAVHADMQAYFAAQVEPLYASATQFTFAVAGDIHVHPSGFPTYVLTRAAWQAQVQNWTDAGHRFGIVIGDLGYGDFEDISDVAGGWSAVPNALPVYYAIGNHELDGPAGRRAWVDGLYPGAVSPSSWTSTGSLPGNADRAYWSFNVGPYWHFAVLDANVIEASGANRAGTLGTAQLNWLAADLQANSSRHVMVFVHEPVDQAQYDTPYYTLTDRGRLLDILGAHPKQKFVFSAHLHGYKAITYWKGVTLVHASDPGGPGVNVAINGENANVSWAGMTAANIVQYDEAPMYQVETDGVSNTLRVGEDGGDYGRFRDGNKMVPVAAENGVTPTHGSLMLKGGPITWYDQWFISEQLVKIVPGMTFSYDIYLSGTSPGQDAVGVQPLWMMADGSVPPVVTDQNGIALSTRTRDGSNRLYYEDLPTLDGWATGNWYHRVIDLTPLAGNYADGFYLAARALAANVGTVYVDNIQFNWPADGALPQAAAPTFNPPAGTYSSPQMVTISGAPGAAVYYTTDGTAPTTNSTLYTGPVSVDTATTIKAIATAPDRRDSNVAVALYTLQAAAPTFTPGAGTYGSSQLVTIGSVTAGAAVYYTLDGSVPTEASTPYTGPITVSEPTTLTAIAVVGGWNDSSPATATYTFSAATPTFSPAAGTYTVSQSVEIAVATPGATIYYTTDGTTPTTASAVYMDPIPVTLTTTVNAIAVVNGWTDSSVGSATYTLKVVMPAFTPAAGTYTSTRSVAISTTTEGATIYYTTNGTTPTTESAMYTDPIPVTRTTTIKAMAALNGWTNSSVRSGTYTLKVPLPTFTPVAGTYTSTQSVAIAAMPGATIHYTTNGTTPTTASPVYTEPIPITRTTTVKALAVLSGWTNSNVATAKFTLKVATPAFSPSGGTYTGAQSVTISTTTPGATIYYTTNGTTPTTSSTVYTGPVPITTSKTLKAIAALGGWSNSSVATAIYTIQ